MYISEKNEEFNMSISTVKPNTQVYDDWYGVGLVVSNNGEKIVAKFAKVGEQIYNLNGMCKRRNSVMLSQYESISYRLTGDTNVDNFIKEAFDSIYAIALKVGG